LAIDPRLLCEIRRVTYCWSRGRRRVDPDFTGGVATVTGVPPTSIPYDAPTAGSLRTTLLVGSIVSWAVFAAVWAFSALKQVLLWPTVGLWLLAVGLTIGLAVTTRSGTRWTLPVVALGITIMASAGPLWEPPGGSLWSLIGEARCWPAQCIPAALDDPEAFFDSHRADFDEVARLAVAGEIAGADDFYGGALPTGLARLSATGKAGWVSAWQRGEETSDSDPHQIFFVPVWSGFRENAGGFLYVPGEPDPNLGFDLYGMGRVFEDAEHLSGDWWVLL
jgi:hypothetical protein